MCHVTGVIEFLSGLGNMLDWHGAAPLSADVLAKGPTLASERCTGHWIFEAEATWRYPIRGVFYAVTLIYFFIGIARSTATFMVAMEVMVKQTRSRKRIHRITGMEVVEMKRIWNPAVADITLLAVGTSVPPIAISVIEAFQTLGNSDDSGLGLGVIIGSAAFNILVTSAVCVLVPKKGTVKRFENLGVYVVELIWSIWAYIWLLIVLQVSSPNVVTLWEAIATVLQFPILILHAYAQDKEWSFINLPLGRSICATLEHETSENVAGDYVRHDSQMSMSGESSAAEVDSPFENQDAEQGRGLSSNGVCVGTSANHTTVRCGETCSLWMQQFWDAIDLKCRDGDVGVVRLIMLPWNVLFAFIPPPNVAHGWMTYILAIALISIISDMVIDLVTLLGCVTGISEYVMAVSILAAGSSWPVLVASKISTKVASTADAAIANVNCSNSINVYAGIGIPWLVHVVYNQVVLKSSFRVPTNGLGFSLVLYFVVFVFCVLVWTLRRCVLGGEFGGSRILAWISSAYFLVLWVFFVLCSILRYYNKI